MALAEPGERLEQLRARRLLAFRWPKQPISGVALDRSAARTSGAGQAGAGSAQIGPS